MRPHDNYEPIVTKSTRRRLAPSAPRPDSTPSNYAELDTRRGPEPVPEWVITSDKAWDTDLGVLKTGKEAEVSLLERSLGDQVTLLAAKRYRHITHRGFRNDAVYRAGRQMRDVRAQKAADKGSTKGTVFRASQWATNEFDVLSALWSAGAAVPYPVQIRGTEILMEYLGDANAAAPRLSEARIRRKDAPELFAQTIHLLRTMSALGLVHGDLSAYNLMLWRDRVWAIDFPQAVDLVLNPNARTLLERDVTNVSTFFRKHGVATDETAVLADLLPALSG